MYAITKISSTYLLYKGTDLNLKRRERPNKAITHGSNREKDGNKYRKRKLQNKQKLIYTKTFSIFLFSKVLLFFVWILVFEFCNWLHVFNISIYAIIRPFVLSVSSPYKNWPKTFNWYFSIFGVFDCRTLSWMLPLVRMKHMKIDFLDIRYRLTQLFVFLRHLLLLPYWKL